MNEDERARLRALTASPDAKGARRHALQPSTVRDPSAAVYSSVAAQAAREAREAHSVAARVDGVNVVGIDLALINAGIECDIPARRVNDDTIRADSEAFVSRETARAPERPHYAGAPVTYGAARSVAVRAIASAVPIDGIELDGAHDRAYDAGRQAAHDTVASSVTNAEDRAYLATRAARVQAARQGLDPSRVAVSAENATDALVAAGIAVCAHRKDSAKATAAAFTRAAKAQQAACRFADGRLVSGALHRTDQIKVRGGAPARFASDVPKPSAGTLVDAHRRALAAASADVARFVRELRTARGPRRKTLISKIRAMLHKWSDSPEVCESARLAGWKP